MKYTDFEQLLEQKGAKELTYTHFGNSQVTDEALLSQEMKNQVLAIADHVRYEMEEDLDEIECFAAHAEHCSYNKSLSEPEFRQLTLNVQNLAIQKYIDQYKKHNKQVFTSGLQVICEASEQRSGEGLQSDEAAAQSKPAYQSSTDRSNNSHSCFPI